MSTSERAEAYSLLTYNVCHADMLVSLYPPRTSPANLPDESTQFLIARPRFNSYHLVSERIWERLTSSPSLHTISYPAESNHDVICPIGFVIDGGVEFDDWSPFQIRDGQIGMPTAQDLLSEKPVIHAVYFPLIAILIPKWFSILAHEERFADAGCHKLLYLISGSGVPRDPTAQAIQNSTETTAKLITFFIDTFYDNVKTVPIHSSTPGMFRYDDNIDFVNEKLRPAIESRRTELAQHYGAEWKERFHVNMTLTAGAPARILSIHNALRRFEPDTLHIWQTKSFWHDFPRVSMLKDTEVEYQSFRSTELSPPIPVKLITDELMLALIKQMNEHRLHFERAVDERRHELDKFWLRKTRQPVLAILVTQRGDLEPPRFWRGMNVEVSMPTGSLCSERAAIAAALAADPALSRRDFRLIAVLSHSLQTPSTAVMARTSHTLTPQKLPSLTAAPSVAHTFDFNPAQSSSAPSSTLSSSAPSTSLASTFASVSNLPPAQSVLSSSSSSSSSSESTSLSVAIDSANIVAGCDHKCDCSNSLPAAAPSLNTNASLISSGPSSKLSSPNNGHQNLGPVLKRIFASPLLSSTASMSSASSHSNFSSPNTIISSSAALSSSELPPQHHQSLPPQSDPSASAAATLLSQINGGAAYQGSQQLSRQSSDVMSFLSGHNNSNAISGTPSAMSSFPGTPKSLQRHPSAQLHLPASFAPLAPSVAKDLNPLAPCGSCKEWLKKIAEVNPDFKVVTFSSAQLDKLYIDPVINWS